MDCLNAKNRPEYWSNLAEHLKRELDAEIKLARRASLQCAIARVLGEKLGDWDQAFKYLDAAVEAAPVFQDVLWEAWRVSSRRDPQKRATVLEYLSAVLEDDEDLVSCMLRQARLYGGNPEKRKDALECAEQALEIAPERRDGLWCMVETFLQIGEPAKAVPYMEKIWQATQDPVLRSSLLLEASRIKRSLGADGEEVSVLLQEALAHPEADWSAVNEALRAARSANEWQLCDKLLERLAEAALAKEPDTTPDMPTGHTFRGFDRGAEAAAAHFWLASWVREKKLNLPEHALEALERASDLLPENRFLRSERPRLLCAAGRPAEALQAMPDFVDRSWKVETALVAGRPDLAVAQLQSDRESARSVFCDVLYELASKSHETPPESDDLDRILTWFLTHPSHPLAPEIATKAIALGGDIPVLALCVKESARPGDEDEWPPSASSQQVERWQAAVNALLKRGESPQATQAQAYLSWAGSSTDPKLQAELLTIAGRIAETEGDSTLSSEQILGLYQRALDFDPEHPYAGPALLKLLRSLWLWEDLASRLAELAAMSSDKGKIRAALYELAFVLEHALLDPDRADDTYADIAARDPSDVAAIWSSLRMASRRRDWAMVARQLDHMVDLCPDDAHLLHLLAGEVDFLALGRGEEALAHFEAAGNGPDRVVAQAARMYRIFALHKTGDLSSLDVALQEEALASPREVAELWIPEVLDVGRAVRGANAIPDVLGESRESTSVKLFLQLTSGFDSHDPNAVAESLREVAGATPRGAMADACTAAAALLDGGQPANTGQGDGVDSTAYSEELLWHTADRLTPRDDLVFQAHISKLMADAERERSPLEHVDWMLSRAEAQERLGDAKGAMETIAAAMETAPAHIGLLHARMRVAKVLGMESELVDAHKELADVYASAERKADLLADAAAILVERLGDEEEAEALCRNALSHSKANGLANELLTKILRKRGDKGGLASLIQQRIKHEGDTRQLVDLYQEQIAQLIALEDYEGALAAVDKLISIEPERLATLLTKIGLLYEVKQWDKALSAMNLYLGKVEDPVEIRSMTWRIADLLTEQLDDNDEAMEVLTKLVHVGDRHPETERKLVGLAMKGGRWDKAADALNRLAQLTEDPMERAEAKREEARIRLEHMFDDEGAAQALDEALTYSPADLDAIRFSLEFRGKEAVDRSLERAMEAVRIDLAASPVDLDLITSLREISHLREQREMVALCDDAISALSGATPTSLPGEIVPTVYPDANHILGLMTHPDERSAASIVAKAAAGISADVFSTGEYLPSVGRNTLVNRL